MWWKNKHEKLSAGRVSSRTYFFLGVLVGDMAQIGRSSSSRRAQVCWLGPEPLTKLFLHILTPRGRLGAVQHGFMQGISARVFLDRSRAPKPL